MAGLTAIAVLNVNGTKMLVDQLKVFKGFKIPTLPPCVTLLTTPSYRIYICEYHFRISNLLEYFSFKISKICPRQACGLPPVKCCCKISTFNIEFHHRINFEGHESGLKSRCTLAPLHPPRPFLRSSSTTTSSSSSSSSNN